MSTQGWPTTTQGHSAGFSLDTVSRTSICCPDGAFCSSQNVSSLSTGAKKSPLRSAGGDPPPSPSPFRAKAIDFFRRTNDRSLGPVPGGISSTTSTSAWLCLQR